MLTFILTILVFFIGAGVLIKGSYNAQYTITYIKDEFFIVRTSYILGMSLSYQFIGANGTDEEGFLYAKDAIRAAKRLSKGKSMYKSTNIEKEV